MRFPRLPFFLIISCAVLSFCLAPAVWADSIGDPQTFLQAWNSQLHPTPVSITTTATTNFFILGSAGEDKFASFTQRHRGPVDRSGSAAHESHQERERIQL